MFANRSCPIPDRTANALVLALHSLRGTHQQPRHRDELDHLERVRFTDAERAEIARIAGATGCVVPLHAVLAAWGVQAPADPALARSPRAREWARKAAEAQGTAASWLLLLRTARWRHKPEVVARALWPSRADFALDHPEVPDRPWPQTRARLARWGRGFGRLPAAVRALRHR